MNRCQRFEGQQWRSFCSNLKSPWIGWAGLKRLTDRAIDSSSVTYVPASSTWLSLPISGFLCSSPSPALKHHGGFNDPACKKYCEEEEMERRSKTITKCLALWKKRLQKPNWRQGVDLATDTQNHIDVAVRNRTGSLRPPPPSKPSDKTPNPPGNTKQHHYVSSFICTFSFSTF